MSCRQTGRVLSQYESNVCDIGKSTQRAQWISWTTRRLHGRSISLREIGIGLQMYLYLMLMGCRAGQLKSPSLQCLSSLFLKYWSSVHPRLIVVAYSIRWWHVVKRNSVWLLLIIHHSFYNLHKPKPSAGGRLVGLMVVNVAYVVVVCNAAGGPAAGRVSGRAADTARRASTVTSR